MIKFTALWQFDDCPMTALWVSDNFSYDSSMTARQLTARQLSGNCQATARQLNENWRTIRGCQDVSKSWFCSKLTDKKAREDNNNYRLMRLPTDVRSILKMKLGLRHSCQLPYNINNIVLFLGFIAKNPLTIFLDYWLNKSTSKVTWCRKVGQYAFTITLWSL